MSTRPTRTRQKWLVWLLVACGAALGGAILVFLALVAQQFIAPLSPPALPESDATALLTTETAHVELAAGGKSLDQYTAEEQSAALKYGPWIEESETLPESLRAVRDALNREFDALLDAVAKYEAEEGNNDGMERLRRISAIEREYFKLNQRLTDIDPTGSRPLPHQWQIHRKNSGFYEWVSLASMGAYAELEHWEAASQYARQTERIRYHRWRNKQAGIGFRNGEGLGMFIRETGDRSWEFQKGFMSQQPRLKFQLAGEIMARRARIEFDNIYDVAVRWRH